MTAPFKARSRCASEAAIANAIAAWKEKTGLPIGSLTVEGSRITITPAAETPPEDTGGPESWGE